MVSPQHINMVRFKLKKKKKKAENRFVIHVLITGKQRNVGVYLLTVFVLFNYL